MRWQRPPRACAKARPIGRSLAQSKLFPPMTMHLISCGESSGELDNMLERAATNQERELDSMMGALVGLLGPLLIVVMGIFVMGIVFAMLHADLRDEQFDSLNLDGILVLGHCMTPRRRFITRPSEVTAP